MQDSSGNRKASNGVLPIPASQTTVTAEAPTTSKSGKTKTPIEGDKVVIRRLPPGLSEDEFWTMLGPQWRAGKGLVDWANFRVGKISQDPAKTSKPGRAYLHVKKRESLAELSDVVQSKSWEDAKLTYNNPCLVGPPILEFSIYKKIPSSKKRSDPRQGTIDQDPDFMAFLHSLTNPESEKEAATGDDKATGASEEASKLEAKVTTTPLIEYIKEKKANKAKEAAAAKNAKHTRQESQGGKSKPSTTDEPKKSRKERDKEKDRASKSTEKPKETVKILTKKGSAEPSKATETTPNQSSAAIPEAPKSRRANIAAAARILQRDLGLSPGSAHRRARLNAAKSEAESKSTTSSKDTTTPATADSTNSTPKAPAPEAAAPAAANTGPATQSAERPPTPTAPRTSRSRRGGGKNASASANANDAKTKASDSPTAPQPGAGPTKAPVVLLKKKDNVATSTAEQSPSTSKNTSSAKATPPPTGPKASTNKSATAAKKSSAITAGATRGFVKHANPSQGVTEAALKQALETFGAVTFVEIDRRKGFAYVDFSEHEALVKAITASPVTVGQAAVQILERKEKKAAGGGNNQGAATPAAAAITNPPATTQKAEQSSSRRNRRGRGGGSGGGKGGSTTEGTKNTAQQHKGGGSTTTTAAGTTG